MAFKALVLLGLLAALLIVSEVATASGTVNSASEETVQPDQYGGRGGYNGGHNGGGYNGGGHNGGGYNGGGHNGGGYNGGGYGGRGGYCRYGCCYRGYHGCARCCSYAGEADQAQPGH